MTRMLILFSIVLAAAAGSLAQMPMGEFRRILVEKADFSPDELERLDGNKSVVKTLRSDDKQEIALIGVVSVGTVSSFSLEAFRNSLAQRSDKTVLSRGLFSEPPLIADLDGLKLEKRDYEELSKCRPGDCDVNLTTDALKRLGTEIDWNSPDHRSAVDRFVRELLLGYAIDYRARGDRALAEYTNRSKPFDPARAHRTLLEESLFIKELAPVLFEYIAKFPELASPDTASELRWSSIDFGLNPAIILTHTVAASHNDHHFVVNKQIYGSRYLDVSLSIAMLVRVADGGEERVYFVFTDRSRTDALSGAFRSMARRLVASEAKDRITKILEKGRTALIADARKRSQTDPEPAPESLLSKYRWPLITSAIALIVLALWFIRTMQKRTK
ncbi:MAG: hypothetical protein IPN69_21215 [Acidobacteria bacterium]|nr:hypothetical protein [Acidobacteriota bacterium]